MESRGPKDQFPPLWTKSILLWSGCCALLGWCGWNTKEPGTAGAPLPKFFLHMEGEENLDSREMDLPLWCCHLDTMGSLSFELHVSLYL